MDVSPTPVPTEHTPRLTLMGGLSKVILGELIGYGVMVDKTGHARTDFLIDKNAPKIQLLEKLADEKAEENARLIQRIYESRAKRLGRGNV